MISLDFKARLASFVAIAKGDVPDFGFIFGLGLTPIDRGSALISWSGSMFEYFDAFAFYCAEPAESLVGQTNRLSLFACK